MAVLTPTFRPEILREIIIRCVEAAVRESFKHRYEHLLAPAVHNATAFEA